MNGLDHEFARFAEICLSDATPDAIANIKRMYLAGALAQANRIFSIFEADIPTKRKHALLRRIARECEGFQKTIIKEAQAASAEE